MLIMVNIVTISPQATETRQKADHETESWYLASINERLSVNHDFHMLQTYGRARLALCIGCSASSGSSGGPVTGDASTSSSLMPPPT